MNKEFSAKEMAAANQNIKERDYWYERLGGEPEKGTFPYDRKHSGDGGSIEYEKVGFCFTGDLFAGLVRISNRKDQALHMILTAALTLLMQRYNYKGGEEGSDIILGAPIYKRETEADFINRVLVLRNRVTPGMSFKELLVAVRKTIVEAVEHQNYPMGLLMEQLNLTEAKGGDGSSYDPFPLIDVALLLENIHDKNYILPALPNVIFSFKRGEAAIEGVVEYNKELYDKDTIEAIGDHFVNLVGEALGNLDDRVFDIEIFNPEEREKLILGFNNNFNGEVVGEVAGEVADEVADDVAASKTLHHMFGEQAAKTPENIALIGPSVEGEKEKQLTYRQLDEASDLLAAKFLRKGITAGTPVGIMMSPSVEAVTGLVGILKSGGAYLPINNSLPAARIQHMLTDSRARFLLSDRREAIELLPQVDVELSGAAPHIKAFDQLAMPDRSLINQQNYKNKIGMASVTNSISIQATRGCPYKCIYCHKVWSKHHVFRSAENIFEEVEFYYKKGVRNFEFIDDCFNLHMENSARFFRKVIEKKLDIRIFFPNGLRGDIMTPEYIDLMVEAGCRGINLSLETASPRLQKLLKKNLDIDRFREVMEYIAQRHPNVVLEIATMHGFPTETEEEAMLTLDFIKSIKWLHFPYIHILKVYPNTEMEDFALEHGVAKEDILRSKDLAFHELPDTLPFPKSFTRQYQADFLNNYFLLEERLRHVLPVQMEVLHERAMVDKYNAYLPADIGSLEDILKFTNLEELREQLRGDAGGDGGEGDRGGEVAPELFEEPFVPPQAAEGARRILLLDLTSHFSSHSMLYNVSEPPLGLIYLMTYAKQELGDRIDGRIYKSGEDFDSFDELKQLVEAYDPELVGIRSLTFYKEFFHETVSYLRQWGVEAPIIAGGPYASSDYPTILNDKNIVLAVLGEGEYIFKQLLEEMLDNNFEIPGVETLRKIPGIAFVDPAKRTEASCELLTPEPIPSTNNGSDCFNVDKQSKPCGLGVQGEPPPGARRVGAPGGPPEARDGNPLAYIMYTSGTTGTPKGVMIEHRQVINCITWMQETFKLEGNHKVVHRTPLTFDPSVWEIFWPLTVGASVRVLEDGAGKDAGELIRLLTENDDFTVMYTPASLATAIAAYLGANPPMRKMNLPYFLVGAEPIAMETVKAIYRHLEGQVVNTYGPTEGTINNTYYFFPREDKRAVVPIGQPVANNGIYILSENLQLMPIKVPGEICIGGASLARGYLNDPEKTAGAFVDNPYGKGKLYHTGDIGRWLPEGLVEIMGRSDEQLKIRGYRIEPAEIEAALISRSDVDECVVLAAHGSMWEEETKVCRSCGITNVYANITVNENGYCQHCGNLGQYQEDLDRYFKELEDLKAFIQEKNEGREKDYDCLMVYNGGRGAAYALYRMVDMGLRVLTLTYDNGYFSKRDLANIKMITDSIGVDNVVVRHPNTDPVLKLSIKQAHTVCRGCFHISSSLAADYAMRHNIPVTVGATLSRGQIVENKLLPFLGQGITSLSEMEAKVAELSGSAVDIDKSMFDLIGIEAVSDRSIKKHVTGIDFYRYCDITNPEMIAYLNSRHPYWRTRKNYAIYSTNCAIKQLGDFGVLREAGTHYYGAATSWEKRLGHMTLKNLEEDLNCTITASQHNRFLDRFGLQPGLTAASLETFIAAYIVSNREDIDVAAVREDLGRHLPEYMIPAYITVIDHVPLTATGKVDRAALPDPRKGVARQAYIAPEEGVQKKLADTWSEILGLEKVGIDDNFFQVGGDSIKAIQISAKLVPQQLKLEIKDIFANPTIRQLEPFVKPVDPEGPVAEQGFVEGETPLTPIQSWFFESHSAQYRHHFNQAVMLHKKDGFDPEVLRRVLTRLVEHHDALRMVVSISGDGTVKQVNRGNEEPLFGLECFDFSDFSENRDGQDDLYDLDDLDELDGIDDTEEKEEKSEKHNGSENTEPPTSIKAVQIGGPGGASPWPAGRPLGEPPEAGLQKAIAEAAEKLQGSIDLEKGPLLKAGLFKTAEGDHLLIVVHHFVVDGISWRILLEDLDAGYRLADVGEPVVFPSKTHSYREWGLKLAEYAAGKAALEELDYWQSVEGCGALPLPVDYFGETHLTFETRDSVNIRLSEADTAHLLTDVNRAYNTEINDILLAALAVAIKNWGDLETVAVTMEGHGRESILPGINPARTVGWFTSRYPVVLDLSHGNALSDGIKGIKETLRKIPNRGIGYGILRYLTPSDKKDGFQFALEPNITFNYLGQFGQEKGADEGIIEMSHFEMGNSIHPSLEQHSAVDISGMVTGGRLSMSFTYNRQQFEEDTIESMAENYRSALEEIIRHCTGKEETEMTVSDYSSSDLDEDEVDAVFDELELD